MMALNIGQSREGFFAEVLRAHVRDEGGDPQTLYIDQSGPRGRKCRGVGERFWPTAQ